MKKTFIFFCLNILIQACYSQNFIWAKQLGGNKHDEGFAVTTDAAGNVYSTGFFSDTADFDPGSGVYNLISNTNKNVIFISKVDASGNFVFAKQMKPVGNGSGDGQSICIDAAGDIYITGNFSDTVDFDPGPGSFILSTYNNPDIFVAKYNSSGNFIWAKQFKGATNKSDIGYSIAADPFGDVCVTGIFSDTVDFDPGPGVYNLLATGGGAHVFISKLNSSGNFVFAKNLGGNSGSGVFGNSIAVDKMGMIYTTGYFVGTIDFDPGPGTFNIPSSGQEDIFINKLDVAGNFIWAGKMGGTQSDIGYAITVDPGGNILTTGEFRGTGTFDPIFGSSTMTVTGGFWDTYICKFDPNGYVVWNRKFTGVFGAADRGRAIATDNVGNVYTTGYFAGTVDFDPGAGTYSIAATAYDVYVSKLNSNGTFGWAVNFTGSNSGWSEGSSINIDVFGNVLSTVYFSGPFSHDFDPGLGVFNLTAYSSGSFDSYISKLCQPPIITQITKPVVICPGSTNVFSVSPIPGATSFAWSLPSSFSGTSSSNTISAVAGTIGGVVSLTVTNSCGSSTQSLAVTVTTVVNLSVNNSTICSGNSSTLIANGAITYSWSTGATTNSIVLTPTTTSNYTVTGNAGGCASNTKTVSVNVKPTPTVSATSATVCASTFTILQASGATSYLWSTGIGTSTMAIVPSTNVNYTVTGTTNGCSSTATTSVFVNPNPTVTAVSSNSSICNSASSTLTATGANTYSWSTGATTNSIVINPAITTNYTVTGYNLIGCSNTRTLSVIVYPTPTITATTSNTVICIGQTVLLTTGGTNTYSWSTGSTGPAIVVSPTVTTTYSVIGTSVNGCTNTASVTQSVSACAGITELPNDNEIIIFPNPAKEQITISYPSSPIKIIKVFSVDGKLVLQKNNTDNSLSQTIDVYELRPGIYFVEVNADGESYRAKVVKE